MKTFLGEEVGYIDVLVELDKLVKPPDSIDLDLLFANLQQKLGPKGIVVDREKMNHQLYQVLCMNLKDKALSAIKNQEHL